MQILTTKLRQKELTSIYAVADPGFPVGGVDPRRGCFSLKMCAKMKELGPVGACAGHAPYIRQ